MQTDALAQLFAREIGTLGTELQLLFSSATIEDRASFPIWRPTTGTFLPDVETTRTAVQTTRRG
jgi:hypothetical protein